MLSLDPQINYSVFAISVRASSSALSVLCSLFSGSHGDFKDSVPAEQKSKSNLEISAFQEKNYIIKL